MKIFNRPVHLIFFSIYPVLFLYTQNITKFPFLVIVFPVLTIALLALVLCYLINTIIDNRNASVAASSIFVFSAFSYFYIKTSLFDDVSKGLSIPAYFIAVIILVIIVVQLAKKTNAVTQLLNILSIVLLLLPVSISIYYHLHLLKNDVNPKYQSSLHEGLTRQIEINNFKDRNVYYIILDGYGREDVLQEIYGYDNSDFLSALEDLGFFISDKSTANYGQTALSLASSLNSSYVQDLLNIPPKNITDKTRLHYVIEKSRVFKSFKETGYNVVSLPSGYYHTNVKVYENDEGKWYFDQFTNSILNLTYFPEVFGSLESYNTHNETIQYSLDALNNSVNTKKSFFFSHLIIPHPPFIYTEKGVFVIPDKEYTRDDGYSFHALDPAGQQEYMTGYIKQLQYTNERIINTVMRLIGESETKPIIIIQADHGPGAELHWEDFEKTNKRERFGILNAYYFPDVNYEKLTDHETPVNSFRHMFNAYTDSKIDLLPSKIYYSSFNVPYDFQEIPEQ